MSLQKFRIEKLSTVTILMCIERFCLSTPFLNAAYAGVDERLLEPDDEPSDKSEPVEGDTVTLGRQQTDGMLCSTTFFSKLIMIIAHVHIVCVCCM